MKNISQMTVHELSAELKSLNINTLNIKKKHVEKKQNGVVVYEPRQDLEKNSNAAKMNWHTYSDWMEPRMSGARVSVPVRYSMYD
ncbi:MAG: hypothetical protein VXA09_00135 [Burkholderiaceae bacterium]